MGYNFIYPTSLYDEVWMSGRFDYLTVKGHSITFTVSPRNVQRYLRSLPYCLFRQDRSQQLSISSERGETP